MKWLEIGKLRSCFIVLLQISRVVRLGSFFNNALVYLFLFDCIIGLLHHDSIINQSVELPLVSFFIARLISIEMQVLGTEYGLLNLSISETLTFLTEISRFKGSINTIRQAKMDSFRSLHSTLNIENSFQNQNEKVVNDQPKMTFDLPPGGFDILTPLFFLLSPGCQTTFMSYTCYFSGFFSCYWGIEWISLLISLFLTGYSLYPQPKLKLLVPPGCWAILMPLKFFFCSAIVQIYQHLCNTNSNVDVSSKGQSNYLTPNRLRIILIWEKTRGQIGLFLLQYSIVLVNIFSVALNNIQYFTQQQKQQKQMATHPYPPQYYNYGSLDDSYKHYQWGVTHETLPHYAPNLDTLQYLSNDRPNDELPITHIDYSQVSSMEQNFKKLKANQLQVLKQLRRQYEVLKSTDLDAGKPNKIKIETDSVYSNDSASRSGYSQARSSSNSHRQNKSRMKSHQKEVQIAVIEKKQLEVIVANSMRKIQQLLKAQMQLKKTVSELKGKLQISVASQAESANTSKKFTQQIQLLKKMIEQRKMECQSLRQKSKALDIKLQACERNEERQKYQLKGKQERIRALEQEIYLQRSKVTNLQLDIKKQLLDFQLVENKYQNQIALIQKKLLEPSIIISQKNQEINRLKYQLELKDQRYKILVTHADKEHKQSSIQTKQYIKALQNLIATFKDQKQQKANSQEALSLVLQKLNEAQQISKSESALSSEVSLLRKQLDQLRNNPTKSEQSHFLDRIKHLEKIIEDQNVEKFYFFQDLKKLQHQLIEEKKSKQEALRQVRELKVNLRKVEQQAKLYSYQLDTIRTHNIDLTESQHPTKSLMVKVQQMHQKQLEIIQLKAQYEQKYNHHKKETQQYEEQLKIVRRQLAEEEIKAYRIKEELQLKLSLAKTQYQAELNRLQDDLQREKKTHAIHLNEKVSQNVELQSKVVQKHKQAEINSQNLNNLLKERDTLLHGIRTQNQQKFKNIQERHHAEIKGLAQKLENLAAINEKHSQVLSRNAILQQEIIELKRCLRQNRQINEGVDHLWKVKEAEYSNLNSILNKINEY